MKLRWLAAMAALTLAVVACTPAGTASPQVSGSPQVSASAEESAPAEESPPAEASPSLAGGTMTSVFDLAPGDCFNVVEQDIVEEVEVVDCDELHDYELYAAVDHPGGASDPFPGEAEMETYAETECLDRFEAFVGTPYEESELYIFYLIPSADTWADGDREVLCTVYLQDEQMQGSMEGSGR